MKVGSGEEASELALRILQVHLCTGDLIHEPPQMSLQLDPGHFFRDTSEPKNSNAEAFVSLKKTGEVG